MKRYALSAYHDHQPSYLLCALCALCGYTLFPLCNSVVRRVRRENSSSSAVSAIPAASVASASRGIIKKIHHAKTQRDIFGKNTKIIATCIELLPFLQYNENMEVNVEFNEAAFRHNISREDILHAFLHYIYDGPMEALENKFIRLGFDRAGNLLELMYNEVDDHTDIIFHAMECRSIFYHLLKS
ncbi:MAG: hypothetical protein FWH35_02890 [Treponema sp.]|nr:hypothetical protein [Treponema sp.]